MQWVASTLHTTSEHGVSSITTADGAHLGCQQSTELTPTGRFKWTRPFRRKTKSGFGACAITFQTWSTCLLAAVRVAVSCIDREIREMSSAFLPAFHSARPSSTLHFSVKSCCT